MTSNILQTPPCTQMTAVPLRTWAVASVVVFVIVVCINWWHRATPGLPPFSNF